MMEHYWILLAVAALPLMIASAILNRWRGDDTIPKGAWLISMTCLAYGVTLDVYLTALWLVALVLYSVPPWHAVFSAIHGRPPGRNDRKAWQWMQEWAKWHVNIYLHPAAEYTSDHWQRFGALYGVLRGAIVVPAFFPMAIYAGQNWVAVIGFFFLFMGPIYHACGMLNPWSEASAVKWSEWTMGAMIAALMVATGWAGHNMAHPPVGISNFIQTL